jgi:hypothetical protein
MAENAKFEQQSGWSHISVARNCPFGISLTIKHQNPDFDWTIMAYQ